MGMFNGYYHVLDGLISPLEGINPEDIGLEKLLNRLKNNNFKEIIFAFNPSIESETTAMYIKRILEGTDIKITRLASGVPMGANMEYIDKLTLERAIKRIIFSTFLIYGYNMIAVNFQLVVPINAITISLVTFLGAPGLLALVLFKLIIM